MNWTVFIEMSAMTVIAVIALAVSGADVPWGFAFVFGLLSSAALGAAENEK